MKKKQPSKISAKTRNEIQSILHKTVDAIIRESSLDAGPKEFWIMSEALTDYTDAIIDLIDQRIELRMKGSKKE